MISFVTFGPLFRPEESAATGDLFVGHNRLEYASVEKYCSSK